MRWISRLFLFALIGLPAALVLAVFLGIQSKPLVSDTENLTPADVAKAKAILARHDPRRLKAGAVDTVSIGEREINLVVGHLMSRYRVGRGRVSLGRGHASVQASFTLPRNPLGGFVNVETALRESDGLPQIENLRVGLVPVPGWLANTLLGVVVAAVAGTEVYGLATDIVKDVRLEAESIRLTYQWQAGVSERIRARLIPPRDQARVQAFHDRLVEVAGASGSELQLADLLGTLFKLAGERARTGDPVAENRAVLLVLAAYVNRRSLKSVVSGAGNWARPVARKVRLGGRVDFAQHFLTSAVLAATGGGPLADVVGLYKEVDDSRGGSGFSFTDLAADRAGTRFGELATASQAEARRVQARIGGAPRESDFMPRAADLPEFLTESEFKRNFGGVGSPGYERVSREIERRIAGCALYR
jgi:hypothetical protein